MGTRSDRYSLQPKYMGRNSGIVNYALSRPEITRSVVRKTKFYKTRTTGNVSQYFQRLEDLNSKVLDAIHNSNYNEKTLSGQLLMINNITLN